MTDAFDQWREWAGKPPGDRRTSPAESYHAVMDLPPEDRFDREKVNEAALNNDKNLSGFTSMVISARAMWIG
ncbi:hypothetical protein [Bradyrhizobium sp. 17]|uniref:hypothetical protein n=1 Tax=Bradyrhizobium sp. 17 TaxID=2782649 RepID=UPI001FF847A3|nr:hypothetical protein [Bradyrhizobium sp. 17]MCK1519340.1 hypothetical protein [Bradyrhizobium sp. 17]